MTIELSDVTAQYESALTNGRHVAVGASDGGGGGGGGSTGTPTISSVTDNGDGTITIQGSNFGSKIQQNAVLHDYVTTTYELGTANTTNQSLTNFQTLTDYELYDDTPLPVMAYNRSKRHSGSSGSYLGYGANMRIGWPVAHGGRGDRSSNWSGQPSAYIAIWKKHSANPNTTTRFRTGGDPAWRNLSYTANAPSDFEADTWPAMGEDVVIDEGGSNEITGTLVGVWERSGEEDIAWIQFDSIETATSYEGLTLKGLTSGTTLTVPTTNHSGFPRRSLGRVWQWNGRDPGFDDYTSPDRIFDSDGNSVGDRSKYNLSYSGRNWFLWEWEVTLADDWRNSELAMFIDGELIGRGKALGLDTSDRQYDPTQGGPTIAQAGDYSNFGLDLAGWEFDEVCVDNTRQRVYLADISAMDLNTDAAHQREIQRILSWSSTEITVEKKEGALGATQYWYVVNENGGVNEQGEQV